MTHDLDGPEPYPPAGLGDRLDTLWRDLAETRAGLELAHRRAERAEREALQWRQMARHYRHWFARAVGHRVVTLCEEAAPELFVGVQEFLDRSA